MKQNYYKVSEDISALSWLSWWQPPEIRRKREAECQGLARQYLYIAFYTLYAICNEMVRVPGY
jgi:hypothetical protein